MCAGVLSTYNSLADIVNAALGGKPSGPSAPAQQGTADISGGVDKAVANLNKLLQF